MTIRAKRWVIAAATILCAVGVGGGEEARIAFEHALPALDGSHLVAHVVEVTYGPGESSRAHSHPCAVIGYVIEGAVRMQVKGEPEATYKAGQSFYEAPNGVHAVSANASKTERARFVAILTCDHETPLTVPPPAEAGK
ncbi:MAG: cupin domain-containing protein [Bryobacteraceae bacterium]|jgi:quercetin dioxygenase-like cupin family protein